MNNRQASQARRSAGLACVGAILLCWSLAMLHAPARSRADEPRRPAMPQTIEFNRDVRPLLSGACFRCHGPDVQARQGDLRLDLASEAYRDRGGYAAIVPAKPNESVLLTRITTADLAERMPPAEAHAPLSETQISILRAWIEQGAEYQPHWSLAAPRRASAPDVRNPSWVRNEIDRYILARLEQEGWQPSPEADRETLLRRVTLDLTGLPPSLAEIDAFLLDNRPDAYERVVDRLLASPRYGERMAVPWLDAARYADTHGYQEDGVRQMWRWRDWVIDAFNRNMPFDQFTIQQLAGDLLPDATLDTRIATGFNRNHRGNGEGGIIPEEYLLEYAVDRVDTTATVWLGLTMGCARCHDHKFDPVTQREFYQVLAYFNSIPELGRVRKKGNSPPLISAPTPDERRRLDELNRELAAAEAAFEGVAPQLAAAQAAWEASLDRGVTIDWAYPPGLLVHFPCDGTAANAIAGKGESKFHGGDATFVGGRIGQALELDGERYVDAGDVADLSEEDKFSFGAWVLPKGKPDGAIFSRIDDEKFYLGYDLALADGKVQVYLGNRQLDDSIRVETVEPLVPERWHHLMTTYDGSRWAKGIQIYVDGERVEVRVLNDKLNNSFRSTEPLRIGSRSSGDRFTGLIDDVRFYDHELAAEEVAAAACTEPVNLIVAIPRAERSGVQRSKLQTYFLGHDAPAAARQAGDRVAKLRRDRRQLEEAAPTVMVMQEQYPPRETYLLARGEYDKPLERVERGLPASLPPLPAGASQDRLGFARWLVDAANPLTARVTVNRYWQSYFGTGLVKTTEDFGSQGEPPTHPELLDWLATEFVRTAWDVKAMQKLIVTSDTYRQSSRVTPVLAAADPENRLLARGPRFRLSAGVIRDATLAAAGLLVEQVGGPSVKPYQPPGLWEELSNGGGYDQGQGKDLYRRSLYTYWKRTIAPPGMMTFDSASRETCIVRPMRTNTPLQALATMNDVTYVEAARRLAERMLTEAGGTPGERIIFAFRLATGRRPNGTELLVLAAGLEKQRTHYDADPAAAEKLVDFGESKHNQSLKATELAAYTAVASVILNLDEAITKE